MEPVTRLYLRVSTHSRPKAAAPPPRRKAPPTCGFNTQPPEGGCQKLRFRAVFAKRFNTQPPEGGCNIHTKRQSVTDAFQHTAARRRLHARRGAAHG